MQHNQLKQRYERLTRDAENGLAQCREAQQALQQPRLQLAVALANVEQALIQFEQLVDDMRRLGGDDDESNE